MPFFACFSVNDAFLVDIAVPRERAQAKEPSPLPKLKIKNPKQFRSPKVSKKTKQKQKTGRKTRKEPPARSPPTQSQCPPTSTSARILRVATKGSPSQVKKGGEKKSHLNSRTVRRRGRRRSKLKHQLQRRHPAVKEKAVMTSRRKH